MENINFELLFDSNAILFEQKPVCFSISHVCDDVVCTAKNQCHLTGECYEGICTNPIKPNNSGCNDGNEFTSKDVCLNGFCMGSNSFSQLF